MHVLLRMLARAARMGCGYLVVVAGASAAAQSAPQSPGPEPDVVASEPDPKAETKPKDLTDGIEAVEATESSTASDDFASDDQASAERAARAAHARAAERYRAGDFLQAATLAEQGLAYAPENTALLSMLGRARVATRDYEAAAQALERASQASPSDPAIKLTLGTCYEGLNDMRRARAAYDAGLALDAAGHGKPYESSAQYYLLLARAAGDDTQLARRAYAQALKIDPRNAQARAGLGHAFDTAQLQVAEQEGRRPLGRMSPQGARRCAMVRNTPCS